VEGGRGHRRGEGPLVLSRDRDDHEVDDTGTLQRAGGPSEHRLARNLDQRLREAATQSPAAAGGGEDRGDAAQEASTSSRMASAFSSSVSSARASSETRI